MTKQEKHEIACTVRAIMEVCNHPTCKSDREIIDRYVKLHGKSTGLRAFVRKELVAFWTDAEPYLDVHFLDRSTLDVGDKIINLDDAWCWIRASLDDDLKHASKKANLKFL